MKDVVVAVGKDWEAVYIDGTLSWEGHMAVIRDLPEGEYSIVVSVVDDEWLDNVRMYPENLNEVVWE